MLNASLLGSWANLVGGQLSILNFLDHDQHIHNGPVSGTPTCFPYVVPKAQKPT